MNEPPRCSCIGDQLCNQCLTYLKELDRIDPSIPSLIFNLLIAIKKGYYFLDQPAPA